MPEAPVTLSYISPLPGTSLPRAVSRTVSILGSTGSIGRSALDVIRLQPGRFTVSALAGANNIPLLATQAAEFRPDHLGILDEADIPALRALLPAGYAPAIVWGQQGYETLARLPGVGTVLSAQVGAAGLRATVGAARSGKIIALANKESLVLAGGLIRSLCHKTGACILPVDSEHNAIFQCLAGNFQPDPDQGRSHAPKGAGPVSRVSCLTLTASGGPFFGMNRDQLAEVTLEQALAHPNWTMGAKITVDSATLMNKGLELIEAHHLYGLPMERIRVLVHPESVIHSLVEFADGSQLAQLGQPDMRVPISYCLGWPERLDSGVPRLDLAAAGSLTFALPDEEAFPCLGLAREAQKSGGGAPVVLNAANEQAVGAFLSQRVRYTDIPDIVAGTLDNAQLPLPCDSVEDILALDSRARVRADVCIAALSR